MWEVKYVGSVQEGYIEQRMFGFSVWSLVRIERREHRFFDWFFWGQQPGSVRAYIPGCMHIRSDFFFEVNFEHCFYAAKLSGIPLHVHWFLDHGPKVPGFLATRVHVQRLLED